MRTKQVKDLMFLAFFAMLASGCAAKRDGYDVPKLALPVQYKYPGPDNTIASSPAARDSGVFTKKQLQKENLAEWWRTFASPELSGLIDRGLSSNTDLRLATIRLAQASSRADQVRAGMMPSLSAPIGMSTLAAGSSGVPVGSGGAVSTGSSVGGPIQRSYQASLSGTWRADVWGEQRSMVESAKFQLWQAAFDRDNVQRGVVAEIVGKYVEFLTLNDRIQLARSTEEVSNDMLKAVEARLNLADATLSELDQQKMTTFAVQSALHELEQQRETVLATIAFLVGTVPESLQLSSGGINTLTLPAAVPALPSSLLFLRPDVRMAEARMLAADADVDAARARILPPIDLSMQTGYSALAMTQLFQPSTLFWNVLANTTVNIFDAGKRASARENAKQIHEEMVETYARTVYQAVKEVDSALVTIRFTAKRLELQQHVASSSHHAWDSAAKSYAIGAVDSMSVLDAQRAYVHSEDDAEQSKKALYDGYITLFYALGGGVHEEEQLPGKGGRPRREPQTKLASLAVDSPVAIVWNDKSSSGILSSANFWQVELPGYYQRSSIEAVGRDFFARFPQLMENHFLRPRLSGKVEGGDEHQTAWYRVYIAKFATPVAAQTFCSTLQANYQRCRVVSSRSDDTVAAPPLLAESAESVQFPELSVVHAPPPVAISPIREDIYSQGKQ